MAIRIPQTPANFDSTRVIERPDGFYWQSLEDEHEYGPFATLAEAADDMDYTEGANEGDEALAEGGSEIGIADWLDPETGLPAEEYAPHLVDL